MANNKNLVYGGVNTDLMRVLSDQVVSGGGYVTGVIPTMFSNMVNNKISNIIYVDSLSDRINKMLDLPEKMIILPGGIGTLIELFYTLDLSQLKIIDKTIIVLNEDGYYHKTLDFIKEISLTGFIEESLSQKIKAIFSIEEVTQFLND